MSTKKDRGMQAIEALTNQRDKGGRRILTKVGLAAALGISRQALGQWDRVPPWHVLEVERITGINRTILRPDLYPGESIVSKAGAKGAKRARRGHGAAA